MLFSSRTRTVTAVTKRVFLPKISGTLKILAKHHGSQDEAPERSVEKAAIMTFHGVVTHMTLVTQIHSVGQRLGQRHEERRRSNTGHKEEGEGEREV